MARPSRVSRLRAVRPRVGPRRVHTRAPSRCDYTFHTTAGDVTFRAYRALAPHGADRLYALASRGYYDGSPLYRVLPGFVAQFGVAADPTLSLACTIGAAMFPARYSRTTLPTPRVPETPNTG